MRHFSSLSPAEQATLESALSPVQFAEGTRIVEQGAPGDGCYFVDEGTVRLELDIGEVDSDGVLGYLDAGAVLGEFSLLDGAPRSADAWAHTEVRARFLSRAAFERITVEHPGIAVAMLGVIATDLARKMREMNERVAVHIPAESLAHGVDAMVEAAQAAQAEFEGWSEAQVDALLEDIAQSIYAEAPRLAELSVAQTGLGVAEHRVAKIRIGTIETLASFAGRPGTGAIGHDAERGILEVASPVGVVFGLVPLTNPVSTFVFKALICLKARNAVILSCHRSALALGTEVGELIHAVLERHGAPRGLVQWVRDRSSRRKTAMFMAHPGVSLILATGGPGMVKAAYSSGTPAIGVGAGNVPAYVAQDADPVAVAVAVVQSKSFDCGVVCGSESNLIVHGAVGAALKEALEANGAIVLGDEEKRRFMGAIFPGGRLVRGALGQVAPRLLEAAGIHRKQEARLVVVPADVETERAGPLGLEKPVPVVSLFEVGDDAEGFALCTALLGQMGAGHTAAIHTKDDGLARRFGEAMPVSRVMVGHGTGLGCVGFGNGLSPTLTLGCGTWGGGSTTDNVTMDHLRNIRRVAWPTEG